MLGNPYYIGYLNTGLKLLDKPDFIAYIDYLQYWRDPKYVKYLQ
jgi:mediator of RNA polymerase II transcription subunit 31